MKADDFQSDYLIEESPLITRDDLRVLGIAAGVVVVAVALVVVAVRRLRPW